MEKTLLYMIIVLVYIIFVFYGAAAILKVWESVKMRDRKMKEAYERGFLDGVKANCNSWMAYNRRSRIDNLDYSGEKKETEYKPEEG